MKKYTVNATKMVRAVLTIHNLHKKYENKSFDCISISIKDFIEIYEAI